MNKEKIKRFENSDIFFSCPICKEKLSLQGTSLVCDNNHNFDISKYGYVNFLLNMKQQKNYDKANFENRGLILKDGLYDHILNNLVDIIKNLPVNNVLDAGCGEGYYSREIYQALQKQVLAFDISKDSVQQAARHDIDNAVKWFVGDLAQLPMQDNSIDCILDIFSPANYNEFHRILTEDGYLIKVIPGENHVIELRQKASEYLRSDSYSNKKVLDYFEGHFTVVDEINATKTYQVSQEVRDAFIQMTPLLFNVDTEKIDWSDVNNITVDSKILIGKA
ncbi:methyltransferase domain-containing protein [Companilactobacillus nodensis]|uniref:rRNA (Guanine-N1-) methyltransferase (Mycinamicin-resistance protein) n=1 Tax=Companilactobacillus nodensis DSM 19682 = JCM 14932 = NBRC 107160 TaxID=1423775 RepID=A0A0R1K639_9LACO|nr:methyltransferase domain-containing protein [Companilactobacillus nodensis]KRK78896.1 rRNA (guanine-N1-) methyltransferase (mycinamicin-resistance protein) [Companilactobacillus nodensis DSM 19682 = JCM 14932 = NBRC 107160]